MVVFGLNEPNPLLHCTFVKAGDTVAVPINEPANNTPALFAQAVLTAPASTTGGFVKVIRTWSITAEHIPLPVVVNVKLTDPLLSSIEVGK